MDESSCAIFLSIQVISQDAAEAVKEITARFDVLGTQNQGSEIFKIFISSDSLAHPFGFFFLRQTRP